MKTPFACSQDWEFICSVQLLAIATAFPSNAYFVGELSEFFKVK